MKTKLLTMAAAALLPWAVAHAQESASGLPPDWQAAHVSARVPEYRQPASAGSSAGQTVSAVMGYHTQTPDTPPYVVGGDGNGSQ